MFYYVFIDHTHTHTHTRVHEQHLNNLQHNI